MHGDILCVKRAPFPRLSHARRATAFWLRMAMATVHSRYQYILLFGWAGYRWYCARVDIVESMTMGNQSSRPCEFSLECCGLLAVVSRQSSAQSSSMNSAQECDCSRVFAVVEIVEERDYCHVMFLEVELKLPAGRPRTFRSLSQHNRLKLIICSACSSVITTGRATSRGTGTKL